MSTEHAPPQGSTESPAGHAGGSERGTTVSTHILDTSVGRPAEGVAVQLSVRAGTDTLWKGHVLSETDADGRCKNLPALPEGTTHVRLTFEVDSYFTRHRRAEEQQDAPRARDSGPAKPAGPEKPGSGSFFPEVTITFTVSPGEHYHVPLLLNPYGYSVYRGS
ncbi:hydroxyisourate hydrolase [Streptomyces sp. N2-109]|uniref:Hydroxyisourate hydrolase n=1 Tax=Streptomyces gossypii TaxID=2883101 RepID=A0ABT2K3C2_9ACTN|nr:hydroxyisourate hydrolase [Streptomyces gossypii]MCT2594124.1 hydroxyisourate hydrolase [Streptomyces gossypii]